MYSLINTLSHAAFKGLLKMLGHFNKCIGKYDMKYENIFACDKNMLIQWDVQDSVLYVF